MRTRPEGPNFGEGKSFNKLGLLESGLFRGGKLIASYEVTNQSGGFMDISGKCTNPVLGYWNFGEHDADNKLHGKGIMLLTGGDVSIGYINYVSFAPGNYISIWGGKNSVINVGEYYLKDGKSCERGTKYFSKGTFELFGSDNDSNSDSDDNQNSDLSD